ncbi:hypothetical protein [uncultured Pseudosulfitobacter sp.]|uniref:hypothetical protein n=1 Tax=uncultured Pseudosulfitobacter sp. TaxID=2854214 RepID=UPI0030D7F0BB
MKQLDIADNQPIQRLDLAYADYRKDQRRPSRSHGVCRGAQHGRSSTFGAGTKHRQRVEHPFPFSDADEFMPSTKSGVRQKLHLVLLTVNPIQNVYFI